ncbi:MAG: hypothetical protein B7Z13_09745, partial [Caulobacterales bacterium 32-67-6]
MNQDERTGFSERLKTAAEAKKALLAKMKPKAAATDPLFAERAALREAELERVRQERQAAKDAKKQAAAEAEEAARLAEEALAAEA